jgi:hypothetical protein
LRQTVCLAAQMGRVLGLGQVLFRTVSTRPPHTTAVISKNIMNVLDILDVVGLVAVAGVFGSMAFFFLWSPLLPSFI